MIVYKLNDQISVDEFIDILDRSTLGLRRPVNDKISMAKMLANANLIVSARFNNQLIGICRSISDFSFCTYLSDLAVDVNFQKQGIGKELIRLTKEASGESTLILLAAPNAKEYYVKIGMLRFEDCFLLK